MVSVCIFLLPANLWTHPDNHVSRITATHRRSVRHREGLDDRRRGGETHAYLFAFAFGTFLVNLLLGWFHLMAGGISCTTKLCAVDSTWPTNDQTKGLTGQTSLVSLCSTVPTPGVAIPFFQSCNKSSGVQKPQYLFVFPTSFDNINRAKGEKNITDKKYSQRKTKKHVPF